MRQRPYLVVSAALLGLYVVVAAVLLATKDFDDRGPHALKGVPGEWRLFAVKN